MAKKSKKPETTEHGALKVTKNAEDYDLELRWADKVLGLSASDVKALRRAELDDLADRIEGALS